MKEPQPPDKRGRVDVPYWQQMLPDRLITLRNVHWLADTGSFLLSTYLRTVVELIPGHARNQVLVIDSSPQGVGSYCAELGHINQSPCWVSILCVPLQYVASSTHYSSAREQGRSTVLVKRTTSTDWQPQPAT